MSNENRETIADIVREMRIVYLCASDTAARSMYINDFMASYADRIEAAWKREREATREKSSQVCNAAKMHEALVKADAAFSRIVKSAWFIEANFHETKEVMDAGNAIEAALANPPRNCDAFSKAQVLEMLEYRSFSKEDTIEWLYDETKGESNGSK